LCHEEAAGFEVGEVGEAVGGAAEDLQQAVDAFNSAVGGTVGVVPDQGLVGPGDNGVDDVMELGQPSGLVEVVEPIERVEGSLAVVGEVEPVELLQRPPGRSEPRVAVRVRVSLGL
jgi:hypothetical protein